MKKQLLALAVGLALFSGSVYAFETEALVSLDQRGNAAGRFFVPLSFLGGDSAFVYSHSSFIPFGDHNTDTSKFEGAEVGFKGAVGLALDFPMVGRHNILWTITKSPIQGSSWEANVFTIQKDFLYNLTDQVKIGFTIDVAQIDIQENSRGMTLFPAIYPVLGATIKM